MSTRTLNSVKGASSTSVINPPRLPKCFLDLVADSESEPAFAPAPGSSSSISSSRVDVLGSMVLGADTPTPSPVQPSRENGDGPPTPPLQPDQQSSSQLRLLRELRSSKEKNASNLREMARLEDEVAALRRAKTEGGLRSGGGAELSTLLGIVHSEGKDKALARAAAAASPDL